MPMQIGSIWTSYLVLSTFSYEAHRNMKESIANAFADGRCRRTISQFVASLDSITNKGWVMATNNNGLSGHPWETDFAGAIRDVTPPLSITSDTTSCPNKKWGKMYVVQSALYALILRQRITWHDLNYTINSNGYAKHNPIEN